VGSPVIKMSILEFKSPLSSIASYRINIDSK
jgi:hypothetical protein